MNDTTHIYTPKSVCSKKITFKIVEDRLQGVSFEAGCSGNLKAIGRLLEGMPVEEAIDKLKGVACGSRGTSCADQLATALAEVKKKGSPVRPY